MANCSVPGTIRKYKPAVNCMVKHISNYYVYEYKAKKLANGN